MAASEQIIHIHPKAPLKPNLGEPCNGCGICCAAEPCPVSLALLWPHRAPCQALTWREQSSRYVCGMVVEPSYYLRWLPKQFDQLASRVFKRWIAADTRCDADVIIESPTES